MHHCSAVYVISCATAGKTIKTSCVNNAQLLAALCSLVSIFLSAGFLALPVFAFLLGFGCASGCRHKFKSAFWNMCDVAISNYTLRQYQITLCGAAIIAVFCPFRSSWAGFFFLGVCFVCVRACVRVCA